MEVKKTNKANLENGRFTGLLIGGIVGLASMFAAFEFTTREYEETGQIFSMASLAFEDEVVPLTQQIFMNTPPPPANMPTVADIIDIVDNHEEITEEKIEESESTTEAISVSNAHPGPAVIAPMGPTIEEVNEEEIFEIVESQPSFPGGMEKLMQWLSKNLRYPASAQENNIQGRVICQFVVNKDGSIVEPKVIKNVDPALDKEAIRVVSSMPKWSPGKQRGKAVRVRFTLPVTFRLQ